MDRLEVENKIDELIEYGATYFDVEEFDKLLERLQKMVTNYQE